MRENIPAWKSTMGRLQGPFNQNRDGHNRIIIGSKQRTDIGKHCFVNRKITLWNQLPAEALVTLPCKLHIILCEEE